MTSTPQLTYTQPADAVAGLPVNTTIRGFVTNRICEDASIDFGLAVFAGTTDDQATVTGTVPLGIAMKDPANEMDASEDGQYVQYGTMSIIDQDFVWVTTASTTGAYGATVCANLTTGVITIGAAVAGTTVEIGWLAETVTAAGLIKIFVDSRMSNVTPHAALHEDGGADEVDVTDLSGVLADEQDAGSIKGVVVNDAAIADDYILKYDTVSGELGYEVDAT